VFSDHEPAVDLDGDRHSPYEVRDHRNKDSSEIYKKTDFLI